MVEVCSVDAGMYEKLYGSVIELSADDAVVEELEIALGEELGSGPAADQLDSETAADELLEVGSSVIGPVAVSLLTEYVTV